MRDDRTGGPVFGFGYELEGSRELGDPFAMAPPGTGAFVPITSESLRRQS